MGKSSARDESSKADRKFEKKLEFYAKVRDTVTSLTAKKAISKKKKHRSRQKKLKPFDLSSLAEFLPELKSSQKPTAAADFKLNWKSRQKLILKEGKQLSTVLSHPAFQVDPLAAIHHHLQSTQPVSDEKPKKKSSKAERKKKKKDKLKTSSGPQSMDF
ncbi:uncharacterized protein LOC123227005 [Mangifera indica]|uniref:uncharacterized protein LOC123227005 n=1 Tax=Mangifera indica TaxID=29780 RepID=UPI001CFBD263|nr:uncharacterized protein LOC123227005 [Mangifera indica]